MKKLNIRTIAFLATTTLATTGCANRLGSATVTVRVVDEDGQPINGAWADFYHLNSMSSNPGFTDVNGLYSTRLENIFANISGHFTKPGYYKTNGKFWSWADSAGKELVPPADTNFVIVLKRIIDPVQMRQREIKAIFPRLDEPVGFDLEIGDWIFPDGQGKIADMMLIGGGHHTSPNDYSFYLSAEFSGEHNGIQSFYVPQEGVDAFLRSDLPPPPIAPESGYENTFELSTKRLPTDKRFPPFDETRRWIYRIRTVVDDDGKIISANYGWMAKNISIGHAGTGVIILNYYHNPDPHSRSLEPKEIADRQTKDLPKGGE